MGVEAPPRGGAGRSSRDRNPPTRSIRALSGAREGLTRLEGLQGPLGRVCEPSGEAGMFRLRAWAGRGLEVWKEKALEGQKVRRESAVGSGQLVSARTDSREDQGFEVGEAGGTRRFCRSDQE